MPLRCPPPGPAHLVDLPARRLAGRTLWRVFQRHRGQPWYFASVRPHAPSTSGRFDLPAPPSACHLATTKTAAVLEALQDYGSGLLPDSALRRRAAARTDAPSTAPRAAHLTAAATRGVGVTAALWAGADRVCTQAWTYQLHRAGWLATYHGISHDPAGRLRAVTLFDGTGAHVPYDDPAWDGEHERLDDAGVRAGLARYGITVTRSDPELPLVDLDDTGLLEDTDR